MSNYLQDIWQLQEKDPKQNSRSHVSTLHGNKQTFYSSQS